MDHVGQVIDVYVSKQRDTAADGVSSPRRRPHPRLAAPLPLTDREREIVTLAASGLSNREIARRLVVSVRTVENTGENQLYHASTNLGTTDRTELTTLLHGH